MKKIRVRAIKGTKEIFVKAKSLKQITNIFKDYLIVPHKTEKLDDELFFKKLAKNINENNIRILDGGFFDKNMLDPYPKSEKRHKKDSGEIDYGIRFLDLKKKK